MEIDWLTDRTSFVKEHTNPYNGNTFDRWIVKTSVELYLWMSTGFMKLAVGDIELSDPTAAGSHNDMSDGVQVFLHADYVTLNVRESYGG